MQHTEKYALNLIDPSDEFSPEPLNENARAVEAQLAALADAAAADKAALQTSIGSGGKTARIATGSYVGAGKGGKDNPNKLTFDFRPLVVFVAGPNSANSQIMARPCPCANNAMEINASVQWDDRSVSWYCQLASGDAREYQCNVEGVTYYYAALGAAD